MGESRSAQNKLLRWLGLLGDGVDVVSTGGREQARINCLSQKGGGVVSARCGAAGLREPAQQGRGVSGKTNWMVALWLGECGGGWLAGCSKSFAGQEGSWALRSAMHSSKP